jgi:hypothetical protein
MDITDAMSKTSYTTVGSVTGFCRTLDNSIHGRIHTLVGTSKDMGAVPYAGNDPLFWVHHANIDRMWASWNRNGNKNPADATAYPWINDQFVFADANGVRVQKALKNFFSCLALGYDYDSFIPRPTTTPTTTTTTLAARSTAGARPERVACTRKEADLGARPVSLALVPLTSERRSRTCTPGRSRKCCTTCTCIRAMADAWMRRTTSATSTSSTRNSTTMAPARRWTWRWGKTSTAST